MAISNGSGSPGPFKSGQKSIDSGMLNQMWNSMKANQPGIHGSGLLARKTPGGTLIDPASGRRQPILFPPFWVTVSTDGKISVKPGAINNLVPKMSGKKLDEIPAPTLSLPTGAQKNYMVVAKCKGEKNKRFPTEDPEILIIPDTQASQDTDAHGFLALASLTKFTNSEEKVTWFVHQLVQGSVWAERRKLTEPNSAFYYFSRV
jgi:hypothetical protein